MDTVAILDRQIAEQITGEERIVVAFLCSEETARNWGLPWAPREVWDEGGVKVATMDGSPRWSEDGDPVVCGAFGYQSYTLSGNRLHGSFHSRGRLLSEQEVAQLMSYYDDRGQTQRWHQYAKMMGLREVVTNTDPKILTFKVEYPGVATPDTFERMFL